MENNFIEFDAKELEWFNQQHYQNVKEHFQFAEAFSEVILKSLENGNDPHMIQMQIALAIHNTGLQKKTKEK